MRKTREAKLLIWQKKNGSIVIRHVSEFETDGEIGHGYGDAGIILDNNEKALAKNLIKSLFRKLENADIIIHSTGEVKKKSLLSKAADWIVKAMTE